MKNMVLITLLLSLPVSAGSVKVNKLLKDDWLHVKTNNFNILTNEDEASSVAIAKELESYVACLSALFGLEDKKLEKNCLLY